MCTKRTIFFFFLSTVLVSVLCKTQILLFELFYLRKVNARIRSTVRLAIEMMYENFIFVATLAVHLPDDHLRSISSVQ